MDEENSNSLDKAMERMGCFRAERKLQAKVRNSLNKKLQKVLKQTYFSKIPLKDIFEILESEHVVPVMEDGTYWEGLLLGRESREVFELADDSSFLPIGNSKVYAPYTNCMLVLSYYKMPETGNYEVLAYVS